MGLFMSVCHTYCCGDNKYNACRNELVSGVRCVYNEKVYCSSSCKEKAITQILRSASYNYPT